MIEANGFLPPPIDCELFTSDCIIFGQIHFDPFGYISKRIELTQLMTANNKVTTLTLEREFSNI